MAVKYADTYIELQVEKRLPLYHAQKEALSKDIDKFLNGHKQMARQIIPILEEADLEKPSSLDEQSPKIQKVYLEIASHFSKILAHHMAAFDEKQKKNFLQKMREENDEMFQKGRKDRMEKVESRAKSFLGSLTNDQEKILKDNRKIFDQQIVTRSEKRSKLHSNFKTILEQEISVETKEQMIHEAFVAYQKESLSDRTNIEIAKTFMPTLNPAQKDYVREQLGELQEILKYFVETAY